MSKSILRLWTISFLACASLSAAYSAATPPFGSPDEPAHTIKAYGVVNGELVGARAYEAWVEGLILVPTFVDAPERLAGGGAACFAFYPGISANCSDALDRPGTIGPQVTAAGSNTPLYYAPVGVPLHVSSTWGFFIARGISIAMCSVAMACAVVALLLAGLRIWAAASVAFFLTPLGYFLSGAINPNSLEDALAICAWATGAALVVGGAKAAQHHSYLMWSFGVSIAMMCTMRQLSPVWAVVIGVVMLILNPKRTLTLFFMTRGGRVIVAASLLATLFTIWWASRYAVEAPLQLEPGATFLDGLGVAWDRRWLRAQEAVSTMGWLDTPLSLRFIRLWVGAVFVYCAIGLWRGSNRQRLAILFAIASTLGLTLVLEALLYEQAGTWWQGRYSLPLYAGIPIIAGVAAARVGSEIERPWKYERPCVYGLVAVAAGIQAVAYLKLLKRYTVGLDENWQFLLRQTEWLNTPLVWIMLLWFVISLGCWFAIPIRYSRFGEQHKQDDPSNESRFAPDTPPSPQVQRAVSR